LDSLISCSIKAEITKHKKSGACNQTPLFSLG